VPVAYPAAGQTAATHCVVVLLYVPVEQELQVSVPLLYTALPVHALLQTPVVASYVDPAEQISMQLPPAAL
jgi:hypothetical protein